MFVSKVAVGQDFKKLAVKINDPYLKHGLRLWTSLHILSFDSVFNVVRLILAVCAREGRRNKQVRTSAL